MSITRNAGLFILFLVVVGFFASTTRPSYAQDPTKQTKIVVTDSDRIQALETTVTKLTTEITALKKQQATDEATIAGNESGVVAENRPPQGWSKSFATFHTIKTYDDQKVAFFFMTRP